MSKYLTIAVISLITIYLLYNLKDYIHYHLYEHQTDQEYKVVIPQGIGTKAISKILLQNGIIKNDLIFDIAAKYKNIKNIKNKKYLIAGEYKIDKGMSMDAIINKIMAGDVVIYKITIPEGMLTKDAIDTITTSENIINDIKMQYDNVKDQGILLPETYLYNLNAKASRIIERATNDLKKFLALEIPNRDQETEQFLKSEREILTLASIVEREARIDEEKPRIAAVYLNRLKIGMPLQADPTVTFAITGGTSFDKKLTYNDLKFESEYNTYGNKGLPPSPICNPGKQSIKAVLNPLKTTELYFVANGDGGHHFASSYPEHLANVKKYRQLQ